MESIWKDSKWKGNVKYGELVDQVFDYIFSNSSEQVIRPSVSSKLLVHPSTSLIPPSPLYSFHPPISSSSISFNHQIGSFLEKSKSGDLDLQSNKKRTLKLSKFSSPPKKQRVIDINDEKTHNLEQENEGNSPSTISPFLNQTCKVPFLEVTQQHILDLLQMCIQNGTSDYINLFITLQKWLIKWM